MLTQNNTNEQSPSKITRKGITAKELFAKSSRSEVKSIIERLIGIIDANILAAHNSGLNSIEYILPTNYATKNMDKADMQTMIYSDLITIYRDPEEKGGKGFSDVYIYNVEGSPRLHIKWVNGMGESERKSRREYINRYTIRPE